MKNTEGQRLKFFREEHLGLNQTKFAEQLQIRQSHVSALEADNARMSLDVLERLYNIFGYNPNYHIIGDGNVIINKNDNKLLPISIQKESGVYHSTQNIGIGNKEFRDISEENGLLKRQVERLSKELIEINAKLIKAHEKIIHLFEKSERHEYA